MIWFALFLANQFCSFLCTFITFWLTSLIVFTMLAAVLGFFFSLNKYIQTLLKIFEWANLQMQLKAKKMDHQLYKSCSCGMVNKAPPRPICQEIYELRGFLKTRDPQPWFQVGDISLFCQRAIESIVDDEVTKRFLAQELESWNLLTRTKRNFRHIGLRLKVLWSLGVVFRYGVLLPVRASLGGVGICLFIVLSTLAGFVPHSQLRSYLSEKIHLMGYRICVLSLTAIITYHNRENKPKNDGICVANHTTPIDVIILANDRRYSLVGQRHGGLLGMIQTAMAKSSSHIWFNRTEGKDRHLVAKRLSDHVADKTKQPILMFPEGSCVNNTSVMMFRKGSFEIGCTIYPVAIKYDPRFGDVFWNGSKFGLVRYLLRMMSSWAAVCDVWYLPPMNKEEGEDAIQFANRVKAAIAAQGGFADLDWDAGLKRSKVKDTHKEELQKEYSRMIAGD